MQNTWKHGPYTLSYSVEGDLPVWIGSRSKPRHHEELLLYTHSTFKRAHSREDLFTLLQECALLDPLTLRSSIAPHKRYLLTHHLLAAMDSWEWGSVVEEAVMKYEELITWGEPSAAKALGEWLKVPVRTIHSRLKLARDRGLLHSPGAGSRLG